MQTISLATLLVLALTARADPNKLAAILGDPADRWTSAWRNGGKNDYVLSDFEGKPLLSAGPNSTILTRLTPIVGDAEVTIRFRLAQAPKRVIWFWIAAGLQKPEENGENLLKLGLATPEGVANETLNWSLPPLPGQKHSAYGPYTIRSLPPERKTWPEFVRARAEADFNATASLGKRWLTVRYILRKNAYAVYLDDRLLREGRHEKLVTTGHLRFTLFEGVQLGSVSVRPLPAEDTRFEPVELGEYLNAVRFQGSTFDRRTLPTPGKPVKVGKVPFVLPQPDGDGNDHIDLKPSWLRVGLLEGGFDGWDGPLSRWGGALMRDRGRICFRVRNARYRALHLLATATDEADTIPVVTAQFYRPAAGFPVNFSSRVPLFTATAKGEALPVKLADGKQGRLFLVTIPLVDEGLYAFADLEYLEFELTKAVQVHRSYPDPIYYSQHGAGLPSGVHLFGITLARPVVDVTFEPDRVAHIWTAPEKPSYTVTLRNNTDAGKEVRLRLVAGGHADVMERRPSWQVVKIPARGQHVQKMRWEPESFGHHHVKLLIREGETNLELWRSLAYLHPDTRERGGWEEGKGPIFGFWDWGGGHGTPGGLDRLKVMAAAGIESSMQSFTSETLYPAEERAFLEKQGMQSFFLAYQLSMGKHALGMEWDPKKPAEMEKALIATMKKSAMVKRSKLNKPELAVFFAEPVLGPISYMSLPEYYGEPAYKMTPAEEKGYRNHLDQFVTAARAIKREWPDAKCLMPWGLPLFPVPFLRQSKEARDLMDGPALDVVLFERLPEMQLHQVTLSSQLWQLKQEWLKAGKKWANLMSIEGPCIGPNLPGSLTSQQEADHTVRALLILAAYGTTRHLGWPTPFHCSGSWGESHYGSGLCERQPILSPKPVYAAYATLTRQLNRMNFVKQVPTGSHTVLCLQFKHYKTGELLHVFWTLRGKRAVHIHNTGGKVSFASSMDNDVERYIFPGRMMFYVTSSPCYVRGLKNDPVFTLGEADHSDAKPGTLAKKLTDLGDGTWKLSSERDEDYEGSHPEFVRRFPGKMSLKGVGKDLAVHLEKQEKERRTMPFYTSLVPAKPIEIIGKASHLGLWVKASSDWGRVVYCLRDAKGERWLSVGKKGEWNADDTHCWSAFCFDGRRYLTFELPGNAPWDGYREMGTSFWGPYGKGDSIVDLPLTLEKIIVERRTHVIAGTEQHLASPRDVQLGELLAEYARESDRTEEAIRQSRLQMPAK